MMPLRTLHAYLGMLIAPSVLFFACTGTLQIYSLHEAHGDYTPSPLVVKLSSVHKDQVFRLPHKGGGGGHKAAKGGDHGAHAAATNAMPAASASASAAGNSMTAAAPTNSLAAAAPPKPASEAARGLKLAVLGLKAFFTLVALGLIVSTLLGIWQGLQTPLRRRTHLVLLAIGIVVPVLLVVLTA